MNKPTLVVSKETFDAAMQAAHEFSERMKEASIAVFDFVAALAENVPSKYWFLLGGAARTPGERRYLRRMARLQGKDPYQIKCQK